MSYTTSLPPLFVVSSLSHSLSSYHHIGSDNDGGSGTQWQRHLLNPRLPPLLHVPPPPLRRCELPPPALVVTAQACCGVDGGCNGTTWKQVAAAMLDQAFSVFCDSSPETGTAASAPVKILD